MTHTVQIDINGQPLSIETGKVAKQADGAVVVRYGGTMVLATCVAARAGKEAQDFFPLAVEYRERMYAGGRIPGGYFRREGAPSKKETLTSRLIDRPVRPLFPAGFRNEVQVICLAISADQQNDPDILAMNGASAALSLDETKRGRARAAFEAIAAAEVRRLIVEKGVRVDGRKVNEIRPITIEMAYLPRAHGSGLFTRGETQALVSATLGTKSDEQKIEALEGESYRHFLLHYNFPSFSVGEVRRFGSPSRRDIGHGALAERAVEAILPAKEDFPYTIRVVSDILESNGSSSMATVCGASLALMDAGVPLKTHVAGIAMGLIKEGEKFGILTDIMGAEDHFGDMDFKVAGTDKGVTALQMDIKIKGVSLEVMRQALGNAREARMIVLAKMREALEKPRAELSPYAPRFVTIKIRTEKIREIIGPGGKVIR